MRTRVTRPNASSSPTPVTAIRVQRPGSIFRGTVFGILSVTCALAGARPVAQEIPTFRSRTEIVRLDVRVTDDRGQPITDLRPDEIRITENGVQRPILLFRHLADGQTIELVDNPLADLTTNALPTPGHVYVLVFDQLHIAPGNEQRAMIAARDFILNQLKSGDAVAVYGLPGPGPAVNLTTDFARARSALSGIRGQAGRMARPGDQIADSGLGRTPGSNLGSVTIGGDDIVGTREVSSMLRGAADQMVAHGDAESDIFLASLARTMRRMQWIEGRKNLILFSEGFPADHATTRLEQVASAAAESYTVIYPVDLSRGIDINGTSVPDAALADASQRREPLAALALETTGHLITHTNATTLRQALSAIAAQADDYYLVGFEPVASDRPAKYRRVNVSIRRRGVIAHARTGYSMPAEASPALERQAIDAAIFSPKVARALPIEYATYERYGSSPDRPRVILCLSAEVHNLVRGGTADVVFVVRDDRGAAVASGTDHVQLPPGAAHDGDPAQMPYHVQFDLLPGTYWMRVLVRDPAGVIGSADRRLHVWPLTGPGMTTSDLIITRLDGARFDPPACATVHRDDNVLAYMEIYGGSAASVRAADARVEVLRAGSSDVVTTAQPMVAPGSHGETIVRAKLPVRQLPTGEYAARVRILSPNQAPRTIMRLFRIIAGTGD